MPVRLPCRLALAATLLLLAACASSGPAAPVDDFPLFLSWWEGDFTNEAQVAEQKRSGVPDARQNARLTLHVRRVDLPAFGSAVFYAEWNSPEAAGPPVRQRLYAFERGPAPGTFLLRLHIWPRDNPAFVARTTGAYLDPARLKGVTPGDMADIPGCDVTFHRDGDAFTGAMQRGTCRFPSFDEPQVQIYSWSQMSLGKMEFRYKDGWFLMDDRPYRQFGGDWYRFRRITSSATTR